MKITYRIPTEQYAYVEVEQDWMFDGENVRSEYDNVRSEYDKIKAAFAAKPENTMGDKEYTDFLYNSLHKLGNNVEVYEKMNPAQQKFLKLMGNAMERKSPVSTSTKG